MRLKTIESGWWFQPTPLKNDGVRQLRWYEMRTFHILWNIKNVPNHQPDFFSKSSSQRKWLGHSGPHVWTNAIPTGFHRSCKLSPASDAIPSNHFPHWNDHPEVWGTQVTMGINTKSWSKFDWGYLHDFGNHHPTTPVHLSWDIKLCELVIF